MWHHYELLWIKNWEIRKQNIWVCGVRSRDSEFWRRIVTRYPPSSHANLRCQCQNFERINITPRLYFNSLFYTHVMNGKDYRMVKSSHQCHGSFCNGTRLRLLWIECNVTKYRKQRIVERIAFHQKFSRMLQSMRTRWISEWHRRRSVFSRMNRLRFGRMGLSKPKMHTFQGCELYIIWTNFKKVKGQNLVVDWSATIGQASRIKVRKLSRMPRNCIILLIGFLHYLVLKEFMLRHHLPVLPPRST